MAKNRRAEELARHFRGLYSIIRKHEEYPLPLRRDYWWEQMRTSGREMRELFEEAFAPEELPEMLDLFLDWANGDIDFKEADQIVNVIMEAGRAVEKKFGPDDPPFP